MKNNNCIECSCCLEKDHIALCKKILGQQITTFMCIDCLADYLGCTKEDLLVKIEEFKEQGCRLFL